MIKSTNMKNSKDVTFTKVSLPNGWMSNMADFAVEFQGIIFPRSEHLFMWGRIKDEFINIKSRIPTINNPITAKQYFKTEVAKNSNIQKHQQQSEEDFCWMKEVVKLKLEQHPQLIDMLLGTGTDVIYEDVTARCDPNSSALFWGAAECGRNNSEVESFWIGKNSLGQILMDLRTHFWFEKSKEISFSKENSTTQGYDLTGTLSGESITARVKTNERAGHNFEIYNITSKLINKIYVKN